MKFKIKDLKILFADRKSIFSLVIILFSVWFLIYFIQHMYNSTEPLFDYILPLVIIIFLIALIVQNYVIHIHYYFYKNKLTTVKIPFKTDTCIIEIFQKPKKVTPHMKNNIVYVQIPPRKIKCKYILTTDFILLFFKVVVFGVFRRSVQPILVKLNNDDIKYLNIKENKIISFDNTSYEEDTLIVPLTTNVKEIEKINIPDFKELLN